MSGAGLLVARPLLAGVRTGGISGLAILVPCLIAYSGARGFKLQMLQPCITAFRSAAMLSDFCMVSARKTLLPALSLGEAENAYCMSARPCWQSFTNHFQRDTIALATAEESLESSFYAQAVLGSVPAAVGLMPTTVFNWPNNRHPSEI